MSGGERIDSVRMLRGCLTASRTRIPLIRHIVKCNYRGGLSGLELLIRHDGRHSRLLVLCFDSCFFERASTRSEFLLFIILGE